jgi:hypothetical protein
MAFRSGDAVAIAAILGAAVLGMGVQRGLQASYDRFDVDTLIDQIESEVEREFEAQGRVIRLDLKDVGSLHELESLRELESLQELHELQDMEGREALEALEDMDFNFDFAFDFDMDMDIDMDMDGLTIDLDGLELSIEKLSETLKSLEGVEWTSQDGILEIRDDRDGKKKRRIIIRRPHRRDRSGGEGN